jgi:hypothetical protein
LLILVPTPSTFFVFFARFIFSSDEDEELDDEEELPEDEEDEELPDELSGFFLITLFFTTFLTGCFSLEELVPELLELELDLRCFDLRLAGVFLVLLLERLLDDDEEDELEELALGLMVLGLVLWIVLTAVLPAESLESRHIALLYMFVNWFAPLQHSEPNI